MIMFLILLCLIYIGVSIYLFITHHKVKKGYVQEGGKDNVQEDSTDDTSNLKEDELKYKYEIVNSWINNCDQKSGILLAIIGVVLSILFTKDIISEVKKTVFTPFIEKFINNGNVSIEPYNWIALILMIVTIIYLLNSCYNLFSSMIATTDSKKLQQKNPGLKKVSSIFFGSISNMTFENFKNDKTDLKKDLLSQIYINSTIANQKFKHYNAGLFYLGMVAFSAIFLFLTIMFF